MSNSIRKFQRHGKYNTHHVNLSECARTGWKWLGYSIAGIVLAFALAAICALPAHAQRTTNTFNVYDFQNSANSATVGAMTTAAQAQCNADVAYPCVIVFDPILAKFPRGSMPVRCANCTWVDYTIPGAASITPQSPAAFQGTQWVGSTATTDLGVEINNAVTALGAAGGSIFIRSGTYAMATQANFDPSIVSIVGIGPETVIINCTASTCFNPLEVVYTLSDGGALGGFTLNGNGAASQIGIHTGGVIAYRISDAYLQNFTGAGAIALLFDNLDASNGWMERTYTRNLRFDNNAIAWQFQYNVANPSGNSFGYSDLDATFRVRSGQIGVKHINGRLYHSSIRWRFNGDSGETALIQCTATCDIDTNHYNIFAEGTATNPAITVASGGLFSGCGTIDVGSLSNSYAGSASFSAHFRVLPVCTPLQDTLDFGSIANFAGGANTASGVPFDAQDISNPYAGFGFLVGTNINSSYATFWNGNGTNGFFVYGCPSSFAGIGACTQELRVDTAGNLQPTGHLNSAAASNDRAGTIAIAAGTSGTHTFASAYSAAPSCVIAPTSSPGTTVYWVTTSTTAVAANLSVSGTITFNYICFGNPN